MAASIRSEDKPKDFVICDPLCEIGLNMTWAVGNRLAVYAGKPAFGCQGQEQEQPLNVHEVSWDTDMYTPTTRKLANESRNVFILLQKKAQEVDQNALKPYLLKASRNYRAVLKTCSIHLNLLVGETCDVKEKNEAETQAQLYDMVDLIWSLCEILFIHDCPSGIILGQLLEWVQWNFPTTDGEEVSGSDPVEVHPKYWTAVYKYVLQGRMDSASQLLSQHSHTNTTPFVSINQMLAKIPLRALFRDHSFLEVDMKWRQWQREVKTRLDNGDYSTNRNVEMLARILLGEDAVFTELSDLCESWYQMLVAKMLYQNPTVKCHELHHYAQACMDCYGGSNRMGQLDNIIFAAFEFNVQLVIKDCRYWPNLREHLLLEYASTLMSHHSMWQIGVDYFDHCPEYGRRYLEMYIERVPRTTERKAQKVINICEARGMTDQVRSMCKVMARKCLQTGRLGSALTWCLKSKDVAFTTLVAEKYLEEYMYKGEFSNLDLLDHLGPSMLLSRKLTFFSKYREFHKLYEEGEFDEAATLLISLITSRLIPNQFMVTVLTDALPLLETEKAVFSSSQTYELMYSLENLTSSQQHAAKKHDKGFSDLEQERLGFFRLALARNLARTILSEGSVQT